MTQKSEETGATISMPAWGVFRENEGRRLVLVSTANGMTEVDAKAQRDSLNKFHPLAGYVAQAIPGRRVRVPA